MHHITSDINACRTVARINPPCSGRRQGSSGKVVKGCRQASRPVVLRLMRAIIGAAGFLHIEGCFSPVAATPTPAGTSRSRAYGKRLPQPGSGQGFEACTSGAITKHPPRKIETDLPRMLVHTREIPPQKALRHTAAMTFPGCSVEKG